MTPQYDLYVIGLGVSLPEHLTTQAIDTMSSCCKLFSIVQEPLAQWLRPDKKENVEVINLLDFYVDGSIRMENYNRAAEMVLTATGDGRPIGYVTYGNPMAYDSVAQLIVRRAAEFGHSARVLPGISSLDSILCDIQVDMAPAIQVFEASWMMAFEIVPRVDTHVILVQMGSFGSYRAHYDRRQDGSSLSRLVEHLASVYPREHRVSLVRSTASGAQPEKISSYTLERLSDATAEELSGASLYIPALRQPIPNPAMLTELEAT
jgi:precorrin-2 methylase